MLSLKSEEREWILVDPDVRANRFSYVIVVLSAISGFLFGYDTGIISGVMVLIREEFQLSSVWHEMVVSATIGAAWLSSLLAGHLSDRIGRRKLILISSIVFTVGALLMGASISKFMLLLGRIIVGIGIGFASMAVPLYMAEIAEPQVRGRLITVNVVFITGGQFAAALIAAIFSHAPHGWRYSLALAAVPSAIQLLGFFWMPESPRWLVTKDRYIEARLVLEKIRGSRAPVAEELESIRIEHVQELTQGTVRYQLGRVLKSIPVRRALFVGCILQFFQQASGINTVMYYSASILQMSGITDKTKAIWLASMTAGINFFCTFIGLYLIERMGRRALTLLSQSGVFFSLILLATAFLLAPIASPKSAFGHHPSQNGTCYALSTCESCISTSSCGFCMIEESWNGFCMPLESNSSTCSLQFNDTSNVGMIEPLEGEWVGDWCPSHLSWLIVMSLVVYLFCFAPGMGAIPWAVNAEIYPLWARSFCTGLATSVNWIANLIISMTFLTFADTMGKPGVFYIYAGFAGLGLLFCYVFLPETRGRSLEDTEQLFHDREWPVVRCRWREIQLNPLRRPQSVPYVHVQELSWELPLYPTYGD